MAEEREYARLGGVDPRRIGKFKHLMQAIGERTLAFPARRQVVVRSSAHGARARYVGNYAYEIFATQEGLGNKDWIAEWMYQFSGTGKTYWEGIPWDNALMAVNDLIASGAMPVMYLDEVAAGDSAWFDDMKRAAVIAEGYYDVCKEVGMAIPAGESPALRFLIRAEPPVKSAPVLSGCVVGILAPLENEVPGIVEAGDRIIGFAASGPHANGASAFIGCAKSLPDRFLTKLPNGNTFGEEVLVPTRSYVRLVEAFQNAETPIKQFLPGTGDGVAKLAAHKQELTYHIENWPGTPLYVQFMREHGMSTKGTLTTFNCGIGYYAFVAKEDVDETIRVAERAGYPTYELGVVKEGERCVIFGPEHGLKLEPQDQ